MATTPGDTSPTTITAGDVAAKLTRRLASPVLAGIPAIFVGTVTGALAWPGLPAAAWLTVLVAMVLLIAHVLIINRVRPVRMAPNAVSDWSNALDTLILLGLTFGGRGVRHVLVEVFDVPVPAAIGIVAVTATVIAWWVFRRPDSDIAPPPLPLPDEFPSDSTAPADRVRAALHVAGATPGRRIVFADGLPGLALLSDADARSAMTELQRTRAIRIRRNDSALTERQRRRFTVSLTGPPATASSGR
ncbi:hypothetical protein [uncultured Corynebacterium sp.]|uniref:hypothetical protein n=1 Tax=uncultured Corynebacterium sp. TaxID=159447 RepID=UPI0025FD6893|nr:hypothetical protein [uncultured Corynebacterium sp.]